MSTSKFSTQDLSNLVSALLFYDWLLCLGQEVTLMWKWHSGVTVSTAVYAFSRYGLLIERFLQVATIYPMSDRSCAANTWAQVATQIMSITAFSAFSGLRAYALSNRSIWLVPVIIILTAAPPVITIIQCIYQATINLPSPFNCNGVSSISPALSIRFLATMYIVDIILSMGPASLQFPYEVLRAADFLDASCDLITSILVCRFMLSLREFEYTAASMPTFSLPEIQGGENTGSVALEFAAQPSDTLPALISPFAHPVHVDSFDPSEIDEDEILGLEDKPEEQEIVPGESTREPETIFADNAAPGESSTLVQSSV
ncbi:hypothetical protein V8D89_002967 [Ganoderma adspersum]